MKPFVTNIQGVRYALNADEGVETLQSITHQIDQRITDIRSAFPSASLVSATTLAFINFMYEYEKMKVSLADLTAELEQMKQFSQSSKLASSPDTDTQLSDDISDEVSLRTCDTADCKANHMNDFVDVNNQNLIDSQILGANDSTDFAEDEMNADNKQAKAKTHQADVFSALSRLKQSNTSRSNDHKDQTSNRLSSHTHKHESRTSATQTADEIQRVTKAVKPQMSSLNPFSGYAKQGSYSIDPITGQTRRVRRKPKTALKSTQDETDQRIDQATNDASMQTKSLYESSKQVDVQQAPYPKVMPVSQDQMTLEQPFMPQPEAQVEDPPSLSEKQMSFDQLAERMENHINESSDTKATQVLDQMADQISEQQSEPTKKRGRSVNPFGLRR